MGIIGPGLIGAALLDQLKDQAAILKEKFNIDLRVMGITGIRTMVLSDMAIELSNWRELLKKDGEAADMTKFVQNVHSNHFIPNTVLVDCTADSGVAGHYHDWYEEPDPFLSELTSMFERSTEAHSVWVTLKRSSLKSKVQKNKMATAGEEIEYRCLVRATDGKKNISTSVGAKEQQRFQSSYATILKARMTSLKKRERKEKKKAAETDDKKQQPKKKSSKRKSRAS